MEVTERKVFLSDSAVLGILQVLTESLSRTTFW